MNVFFCTAESSSFPPGNARHNKNTVNKAQKRKFYVLTPNYQQSKAPGVKLINGKELFYGTFYNVMAPPSPKIRGFREYPDTPKFLISTRIGRNLNDIEFIGDYWLVSDHARSVLLELSETDFAFLPVDSIFENASGSNKYWLCDVISVVDAVDEAQSIVRKTLDSSGERVHEIFPGTNLKFNEVAVNSHHAFRLETNFNVIICDEELKNSVLKARLTGLRFQDATKI